ncbi:DNA kinase/phosphatase Pnk1, partial [Coemansia sp. RSA 2052]
MRVSDGTSNDGAQDVQWREFGQTWLGKFGSPTPATKFAAFDLDGTLIRTIGSSVHARDSNDWRFYHSDVPKLLRNIHQQGYKIVIMTNQNGLRPNKKTPGMSVRAKDFRLKVSKIAQQLEIPFTILAAIGKDFMRKPSPGMWHMAELDNEGVVVDKVASFYVGDAAGRPAGWKRGEAADHSDSDLAFALNAGVAFYTPEEVITADICARDQPLPPPPPRTWPLGRFSPKSLTFDNDGLPALLAGLEADIGLAAAQKSGLLVLLVGPPACGKSTFAAMHLAPLGFECVNMDTLGTRKKCTDAVKAALEAGRLVAVDNTNPDPASRGSFISIAKHLGVSSMAVVFEHKSRDLAMHNNQV